MYKILGADSKEYGPVTAEGLAQWIAEGRANGQTKVLAEGATEWKSLQELPEFAQALAAAAAGPPPTVAPAPGIAPATISAPQRRETNPLAIAGLILGIISVLFALCCCYGFPFNLAAIICSGLALAQTKSTPQQGRGLAIAGLVLGLLSVLLAVLFLILGLAFNTPEMWRKIQRW